MLSRTPVHVLVEHSGAKGGENQGDTLMSPLLCVEQHEAPLSFTADHFAGSRFLEWPTLPFERADPSVTLCLYFHAHAVSSTSVAVICQRVLRMDCREDVVFSGYVLPPKPDGLKLPLAS